MKRRYFQERRKELLLLMAAVIVASVPLMTDYILWGSELQGTLSRIEVISQEMGKVFPVRVVPWPSLDYGYGTASFQADLFYLVPAFGRFVGMGLEGVYKLTLFLTNFLTAIVAFRCFEKCMKRQETALVGSILYVWCPYRLHEMYVDGNLSAVTAWMFLPIVISGLVRLYTADREEEAYGRLWIPLTCGFSLLALSSTSVLLVTLGMSILLFLFMGKASLHGKTFSVAGKTVGAFLLINAWFLVPMLLRLRDVQAVGSTIPGDFRSLGMYLVQYLRIFLPAGGSTDFLKSGMIDAAALCPGIAVVIPVIFYVWMLYAGECHDKNRENCLGKRLLILCAVLMVLSSNSFPWDLFQNKNMLFSIGLSILQSPAKWGIPACALMVVLACMVMDRLIPMGEGERYMPALFAVGAVSLATTQFFLGNILKTRNYVRPEELRELLLPMQVLPQESMVWRCSEVISLVAVGACLTMAVIRRHKRAEKK